MERRTVTATAPLRVDLAGGFTDVPPFCENEGGFVVNAAIELSCIASISRVEGAPGRILLKDAACERKVFFKDTKSFADVPKAITPFLLAIGERRALKIMLTIRSMGPPSSGLGSSGSALVATLAALRGFYQLNMNATALARRAREIEVEQLQQIGGGQDPLAAAFGGILAIEFPRGARDGRAKKIHVNKNLKKQFEDSILLINLKNPRSSSSKISRVVEKIQNHHRPTLTILREMDDVARDLAKELYNESLEGSLSAIDAHAEILQKLDPCIYENGVGEAISAAKKAGARSGKPCGAGGGGCVAIFVNSGRREAVTDKLKKGGYEFLPFQISPRGVRVDEICTKTIFG